ncbi:MAG: L-threonine 3-dehydrogenase [Gammaproteobacteria bacterium]|nr:L-threonine 3-dehydrogenase [Gammaproteobacteria bacterium]
MKALVKAKREKGIWMQDVEKPTYGVNDVLIQIHKTAICGTDIHIYLWDEWAQATVPTPMVIGHEFFGEVVAIGSEVNGIKVGDRVSGEGHLTCGYCRNCRAGKRHLCRRTLGVGVNSPGAFAEYLAMPASNVVVLPAHIRAEEAAILDPFGNATHTALSFNLVGEDVLITGAGPIGIMACAIAKHAGARYVVVTDINPYRLDLAKTMGATRAVNVQHESLQTVMSELGMLEGFDVGLEMSGNPAAFNELLNAMNHGGNVALLGILPKETPIDWSLVIFKGLVMKGIYGREMYETWYKMLAMLQSGLDLSPILTHRFPVSSYLEAFETMASGQSGKVILEWV